MVPSGKGSSSLWWFYPITSSWSSGSRLLFMFSYSLSSLCFHESFNSLWNCVHSLFVTTFPLMWYTKSRSVDPIVLTLSSSIGTPEHVAASPVFSTVETDASTLGIIGLLLMEDPWWWAPVEEFFLPTRSSMHVLLPKAIFLPWPRPPAMLVLWGVLGVVGISRYTLLVFMQPKTCKLKNLRKLNGCNYYGV